MALLSKAEFVGRSKAATEPVEVDVPSGGSVLIARATTADIRKWRLSLRDDEGKPLKKRVAKAAELFLGRVMLGSIGEGQTGRMFNDTEVMAGEMDGLLGEDIEYLTDMAYKLNGIGQVQARAAEKNSETTGENTSSGE